MMMDGPVSRVQHLINSARQGGNDVRPALLRVVVDQFVTTPSPATEEVRRFTELSLRLMERADAPTLKAVARQLAACAHVPEAVIWRLSLFPAEISVPVLEHSPALRDGFLLAILAQRDPEKQMAIARRNSHSRAVADALRDAGTPQLAVLASDAPLTESPPVQPALEVPLVTEAEPVQAAVATTPTADADQAPSVAVVDGGPRLVAPLSTQGSVGARFFPQARPAAAIKLGTGELVPARILLAQGESQPPISSPSSQPAPVIAPPSQPEAVEAPTGVETAPPVTATPTPPVVASTVAEIPAASTVPVVSATAATPPPAGGQPVAPMVAEAATPTTQMTTELGDLMVMETAQPISQGTASAAEPVRQRPRLPPTMLGKAIEMAVLQRRPGLITALLAQELGITPRFAAMLMEDQSGETTAFMVKALDLGKDVLSKVVLACHPGVATSVSKLYQLAGFYEKIPADAAQAIMAQWQIRSAPALAGKPENGRSPMPGGERIDARAAASHTARPALQPKAGDGTTRTGTT